MNADTARTTDSRHRGSVVGTHHAGQALTRAEAFRSLAERHLAASYRLACAILHDPAEAEDAVHDAFITAWQHWSTLRDPGRFEHWFDRILVNTCRNRLRRAARWTHGIWEAEAGATDVIGTVGDREAIRSALASLSPDHRIVVALRYYRDLTIDEIAERVGVRPGTVKSRLHYALLRLHRLLDEADARDALR